LPSDVLKQIDDIDEAIRIALKPHGERARIGVLECGEVVPVAPGYAL